MRQQPDNRPPDAPRPTPEREPWLRPLLLGVGLAAALFFVGFNLALVTSQRSAPIATPSSPRAVVVNPSPDATIRAALLHIDADTRALPPLATGAAIEQTTTAGNALATWSAARQTEEARPVCTPAPLAWGRPRPDCRP